MLENTDLGPDNLLLEKVEESEGKAQATEHSYTGCEDRTTELLAEEEAESFEEFDHFSIIDEEDDEFEDHRCQ